MSWTYTNGMIDNDSLIRDADGKVLICDEPYYPSVDLTPAQWRLISAAPELLEALREARQTILDLKNSRGSEAEGSDDDWVGDIDAAISKATSDN